MRPNSSEFEEHDNGLRVRLRSGRKYCEAWFSSPKAFSAAFWPELLRGLHEDGLIKTLRYRKPDHGRWGRCLHSSHASVPKLGRLELRKLPLDKVYSLVRRYTEFLSADLGQYVERHNPQVFGRVDKRQFVIKCPWCLAEHRHGVKGVPGYRGPHCRLKLRDRWEYYIHANESILIETIREALPDPRVRQRMLVALPKALPISAQDYLDGHMPGWRQDPVRG